MAHASLTPTPMSAPCPGVPVVVALDLGTSMGWALRLGTDTHSGTVSEASRVSRRLRFVRRSLCHEQHPEQIFA